MVSDRQKNLLYFGVATLIIAALVYLADVDKVIRAVETARIGPLLWSVFCGIMAFTVLGFTWHRFLNRTVKDLEYWESFKLFMSGQFMNSVTPLGQLGGEPVMAYIIKDTHDTSYEKALSTVISADIVNTIPYITFLLGGTLFLLFFGTVNSTIAKTAAATTAFAAIGSFVVYIMWFKAEKVGKLLEVTAEKLPMKKERVSGFEEKAEEFVENLKSIGEKPLHLVVTAAVAHLAFIFQVAALFFAINSVTYSADFTSLYFVVAISSLANFSPTPGGTGTFEAAMAGALTVFLGIGFAQALTIAVLYRISTYWSGLLIGYLSLISLNSKLSSRERIRKKVENLSKS